MPLYASNAQARRILYQQARRYMQSNIEDNLDTLTGEVNATYLAEDAAMHFNLYENDAAATIPEWLFELAYDISAAYELQHAAD